MQVFKAKRSNLSICTLNDVIAVPAIRLGYLIKRLQVGLSGVHCTYPPLTDNSKPLR